MPRDQSIESKFSDWQGARRLRTDPSARDDHEGLAAELLRQVGQALVREAARRTGRPACPDCGHPLVDVTLPTAQRRMFSCLTCPRPDFPAFGPSGSARS